jgi:hypothetical protein
LAHAALFIGRVPMKLFDGAQATVPAFFHLEAKRGLKSRDISGILIERTFNYGENVYRSHDFPGSAVVWINFHQTGEAKWPR